MVVPALVDARLPCGVMNEFSGENDGQVVRLPLPSSTSHPRQNSAEPFIRGQALFLRNSRSSVKR